jgi:hypothetical protein
MSCTTNIEIEQVVDECGGRTVKSSCVVNVPAITLLDLPANSTQEEVNNALVLAINSLINRVELLETQVADHENRITTLEP